MITAFLTFFAFTVVIFFALVPLVFINSFLKRLSVKLRRFVLINTYPWDLYVFWFRYTFCNGDEAVTELYEKAKGKR